MESSLDVNGDDQIDLLDLTLVAQNLGQANSQADINNDGTVDILDLITVAQNLGDFNDRFSSQRRVLAPVDA